MHRCTGIADAAVELIEELQPAGHDLGHLIAHSADALEIFGEDQRTLSHIQAAHLHGNAGLKHHIGCFGIYQNVELCSRCPVAEGQTAAHHGDSGDFFLQFGMGQQQSRHIGLRTGGNNGDRLLALLQRLGHQADGTQIAEFHSGIGQSRAIQTGLTMDIAGRNGVGQESTVQALSHRSINAQQCTDTQSVIGSLFNGLIAVAGGNCQNVEHGRSLCQHPGDGIIMAGVAVQNHRNFFQFVQVHLPFGKNFCKYTSCRSGESGNCGVVT